MWAGLIAGRWDADILDAEALDLTLDETEAEIRSRKPDEIWIVVMGNNPSVSSTPKMPISEALAERLAGYKIALTGIHPIAVGSKFPVARGRPFTGFPNVPWDKLPMDKYRAHNWHCLDGSPRSPYASVYTSLGCPFQCHYCNIHTLYGSRQHELRPIASVLREIHLLRTKYNVRNIKFWDELFALNEKRVITICSGLEEYDLNIWAYARLDSVTPRMLRAMANGGIRWLAYGFENVKDKKFIKRVNDVIAMTRDVGINIIANFMFGLPDTTEADDRASVDFALEHLFDYVNFYVAKPYPGSEWYNEYKGDLDWRDYSQYGRVRSAFRDAAFKEYFTHPPYIEMLRRKFGEQAVKHINKMLESKPYDSTGISQEFALSASLD